MLIQYKFFTASQFYRKHSGWVKVSRLYSQCESMNCPSERNALKYVVNKHVVLQNNCRENRQFFWTSAPSSRMPFSDYLAGRGLKSDDFCFHFSNVRQLKCKPAALPVLLTLSRFFYWRRYTPPLAGAKSRLFFQPLNYRVHTSWWALGVCYSHKFNCDKFETELCAVVWSH